MNSRFQGLTLTADQSSLTCAFFLSTTGEIFSRNIFRPFREHGGKKLSELPNSIDMAGDYFQETRKFFHEKIKHLSIF